MNLFIHAPNVHHGGGAVLLDELLVNPLNWILVGQFDERLISSSISENSGNVFVKCTLWSRLRAEWNLRKLKKTDNLLCFGNLPPLFGSSAKVFVFIQNRLLVDKSSLLLYPWKTILRLLVERLWIRLRSTDRIQWIVQTQSMAELVFQTLGTRARVLPFIPQMQPIRNQVNSYKIDFVYVASGDAHKNHRRLIEAWRILRENDLKPSLSLTISKDNEYDLANWINAYKVDHDLDIQLVGNLDRKQILEIYSNSSCLIYPSLLESYGLPLVEAVACGVPIIASERDFVRDVCVPCQTFDPQSALSISRAVMRFLDKSEQPQKNLTAKEFFQKLALGSPS